MALDVSASEGVIEELGTAMGLDRDATATAVLTLANELMVAAIKEITISEGVDPRESALIAGGGAAGLNIAGIAAELGCSHVLIPRTAGALSAFGGQHSDIIMEGGRTVYASSGDFPYEEIAGAMGSIEGELTDFAKSLGDSVAGETRLDWFVEARYPHQAWTLEVPLPESAISDESDLNAFVERFNELHERVFAVHDPSQGVEILYCRGRLVAVPAKPPFRPLSNGAAAGEPAVRSAYFETVGRTEVQVLEGGLLGEGATLDGPALISEPTTTVVVPPGTALTVTELGNYVLEVA